LEVVRLIAIGTLRDYWEAHPDSRAQLQAWHQVAKIATWRNSNEVKAQYRNASIIGGNRIVFNIAGNKYRLIVKIHYNTGIVYVRFVGTHQDYDQINAEEV
jgi:mRNA interferase HigB